MHGSRNKKMHTWFWWGNLRERDYFDDPGMDGRISLKSVFNKWYGRRGMDRSGSGQGQVADFMNTVMNLLVP
jgi:hypothetical protein